MKTKKSTFWESMTLKVFSFKLKDKIVGHLIIGVLFKKQYFKKKNTNIICFLKIISKLTLKIIVGEF